MNRKLHMFVESYLCLLSYFFCRLCQDPHGAYRLHRFFAKKTIAEWTFDDFQEIKMILDDGKFEYFLERKFYSREKSKEPNFIGKRGIH